MNILSDATDADDSEFERQMERIRMAGLLLYILSDGAVCEQARFEREIIELEPERCWKRFEATEVTTVSATVKVRDSGVNRSELCEAAGVLESTGLGRLAGLFREAASVEGGE